MPAGGVWRLCQGCSTDVAAVPTAEQTVEPHGEEKASRSEDRETEEAAGPSPPRGAATSQQTEQHDLPSGSGAREESEAQEAAAASAGPATEAPQPSGQHGDKTPARGAPAVEPDGPTTPRNSSPPGQRASGHSRTRAPDWFPGLPAFSSARHPGRPPARPPQATLLAPPRLVLSGGRPAGPATARPAAARPVSAGARMSASAPQSQPPQGASLPSLRPRSAGAQAALPAGPAAGWGVREVCDWVAALGLGQYRRRFLHHQVDGRLLLRLGHAELKEELGIGVLGYREAILSAAAALAGAQAGGGAAAAWAAPPEATALDGSVRAPLLQAQQHRRRLLKELERAQARLAALDTRVAGAARQAQLAGGEVQRIRGALRLVDGQLGGAAGPAAELAASVAGDGAVPWFPPGSPPRARPQVPPLAIPPRQPKRRQPDGFLERLNRDQAGRRARLEQRRQAARREGPEGSPDAGRWAADLGTVAGAVRKALGVQLQEVLSGEASLQSLADAAGVDAEAPEVEVDSGSEQPPSIGAALDLLAAAAPQCLSLSEAKARALRAAATDGRKLEIAAAAVKEAAFLARYQADLTSRGQRKAQLREFWHRVEMEPPKPPQGRQQRFWKEPVTQEQRDAADLEACRLLFQQAGWSAADFELDGGKAADAKLDAVLARAAAIAFRMRLQMTQGRTMSPPEFGDGLDELQARFTAQKQQQQGGDAEDDAAAEAEEDAVPESARDVDASPSDHVVAPTAVAQPPEAGGSSGGGGDAAAALAHAERVREVLSQTLPRDDPSGSVLQGVVEQLSGCHPDELTRLQRLTGPKKHLAVFRALVMLRFLRSVEQDQRKRAEKAQESLAALQPRSRKLSPRVAEAFFDRLQADGERRKASREEAVAAAREREAAAMQAERAALTQRLRASSRRPASAGARPRTPKAALATSRSMGA